MARIAIDARKIRDFGIGTYIHNLVTGLDRLDSDDEFLLVLPPRVASPVDSPRFREMNSSARGYGIAEHLALPWQVRRRGVNLFHTPHYVLPWLETHPSVVTIHDLIHLRYPEYLPSRAAHRYARVILGRSYRRATRVLTVSETTRRDLLAHFGGTPERIEVIPNSVPEDFFRERQPEEIERTRGRWRLPRRFVLYTGNVKPHKNLDSLLRAFARLDHGGDDAPGLVLVGNQSGRYDALRRLATELGVGDRVRYLGYVARDELCCLYRAATVFAYPSLFEGFGLPPLEAMASGLPVVAAATGALPEVLGDAALLVEPRDEAIAAALGRLLGDEAERKELARRGVERARSFGLETQARRTLDVYHQVLEGAA